MKVKVGISNNHIHLCKEDYDILFPNIEFEKRNDLYQEGEFASILTLNIKTDKAVLENVRVLGPLRSETQVEIARTTAYKLGINPPVRMSGDLDGSETVTLVSPYSELLAKNSCILAHRHIHCNKNVLDELGISEKDVVSIKMSGEKGGTLNNVRIRVRDNFKLELHVDTDEANAFDLKNDDLVEIVKE